MEGDNEATLNLVTLQFTNQCGTDSEQAYPFNLRLTNYKRVVVLHRHID